MDIHALVEQKVQADTAFQESLAQLPEEEREQALEAKKQEVFSSEITELSTKAQEAEKLKEIAENYKIRAEKAEKAGKENGGDKSTDLNLTPKDYLALTEHKVTSEDFDEVVRVAGILGKPVAEALQDGVLKTILKTRAEERATALATQTGGGNRGSKGATPDVLLRKASLGEVSEDDIEKLAEARMLERTKGR